jgi:plastocyanin
MLAAVTAARLTFAAAENSSVTVYVAVSADGNFAVGNDDAHTVLARLPVLVDYFDLADYGLEDFYRYEADSFENGGAYIDYEVLQRPTLLHLYIKLLEDYYLNGPLDVWNSAPVDAFDLTGRPITGGYGALTVGGSSSPTSFYMQNFWGHDENLMYFVNHQYPLMAAGWGATADYILLEEGMEIDLGMFTDWNFFHSGAFAYFNPSAAEISAGGTVDFETLKSPTAAARDGSSLPPEAAGGLKTVVYGADWTPLASSEDGGVTVGEDGAFRYTFDESGVYYVAAYDPNAGTGSARVAPAIAAVTVREAAQSRLLGDVNGDGRIGLGDALKLLRAAEGLETLTADERAAADVNGDGAADEADVLLIEKYLIHLIAFLDE